MEKPNEKLNMSTEELILDHAKEKYVLVNYVLRWAKEIAKKEDAPKTTQALLDKALRDILTDTVTFKDIKKLGPYKEVRKSSKEHGGKYKDGKKKY